ncbi:unnamed protein product [Notodromas monacha]|uniref:Bifunctional glutamate/proline--tRNA ligase n=1 Tax=Notodromas monacha TaxID=399045 RepID=A0A7R9GGP4_9CRUS|nr:unnamed protein product [Notodromas monacha]CAG0920425.1 unnamed protein product [Notodromas monacha]
MSELCASRDNPPVASLVVRSLCEDAGQSIAWTWGNSTVLKGVSPEYLTSDASICRYLARLKTDLHLYGQDEFEQVHVDHWMGFAQCNLKHRKNIDDALLNLDDRLRRSTYLAGNTASIADYYVYAALKCCESFDLAKAGLNLKRWFTFVSKDKAVVKVFSDILPSLPSKKSSSKSIAPKSSTSKMKEEGKFVALPGAEIGKVVVRFPPEASGYLHIGHAKAALLNQHYQKSFQGKLILRFDDTNPEKEKEDFEHAILEDVNLLNIEPDMFSFTSNFFEAMLGYCEELINAGKAFVDDTDPERMKQEREQMIESRNRNNSVEKNLSLWEEMKKGSEIGVQCCVRLKIAMDSPNGCMRDPTIYRCKPQPHPKTGDKYKVYPTYDFACPIVDSLEGVTHALRTTEYHDRDEQYFWIIDALNLRKPFIYEYARLNMTNTVLSKRRLRWLVENHIVEGWDDPRFPTVRGILRRGLTVEGLKQFILAQGSSRSVVVMEWDKIWAFNKKVIDPVAPRYTCIEADDHVEVQVSSPNGERLAVNEKFVPLHPKMKDGQQKTILTAPLVLIDSQDAEILVEGQNATFINWGNLLIKKIHRSGEKIVRVDATTNLSDEDFRKTPKITWLAKLEEPAPVAVECVFYDNVISKPVLGKDEDFKSYINPHTKLKKRLLGESAIRNIDVGDIVQVQRVGFFICDARYNPCKWVTFSKFTCIEEPLVLNYIPDGKDDPGWVKTLKAAATGCTEIPTSASPRAQPLASKVSAEKVGDRACAQIDADIRAIGDEIRALKSKKVEKVALDPKIKRLLELKSEFKKISGNEWKPSAMEAPARTASALDAAIAEQGDKVRKLKAAKADKSTIDAEVKALLVLKAEYKTATGSDWSPNASPLVEQSSKSRDADAISVEIAKQGNKVRDLKAAKADKAAIDAEVKKLLALKAEYKDATGAEWKPDSPSGPPQSAGGDSSEVTALRKQVADQGDKVRKMKESKAPAVEVGVEVEKLLTLKKQLQGLTGETLIAPQKSKPKSQTNVKAPPKTALKPAEETATGLKHLTRLGLEAKKEDNLAEWYTQVITKSEMIEYYDVSGCYIFRPWSYKIWEGIVKFFDAEIKKLGVENCYFPMFVTKGALEREQTHVADFAPEVAWVTKSGQSELAEPIAIRPTSETVMYPAYAKWIQSYRDLPIKLNQWNSVVRWEFKHPQPFLRTREFLWQEGHSAFANKTEAEEEVYTILNLYRRIYEELLAIPVIRGKKTEKEKFAGGDFTTTTEAYISASGRGIQGATSHHLGQNFSKMFDIVFDHPETGEKQHVYQNSWGITTRTIGVVVMVHGDNSGLVLPPRVAAHQVVIVPCGVGVNTKPEDVKALMEQCRSFGDRLTTAGIRAHVDLRENYSPGWKFNHWELKGVPIRIELGPKDMKNQEYVAVRRDTLTKSSYKSESLEKDTAHLLETIHDSMFAKAKSEMDSFTLVSDSWEEFCNKLNEKYMIMAPFCGDGDCEDLIKKESARYEVPLPNKLVDEIADAGAPAMGAKSLCIPFEQPKQIADGMKCVHPKCTKKPIAYTLFGRSY